MKLVSFACLTTSLVVLSSGGALAATRGDFPESLFPEESTSPRCTNNPRDTVVDIKAIGERTCDYAINNPEMCSYPVANEGDVTLVADICTTECRPECRDMARSQIVDGRVASLGEFPAFVLLNGPIRRYP